MAAPEFRRLVDTPQTLLNSSIGLNLFDEIGKYAEVRAMVGGETTVEEGPQFLLRNPDNTNFGRHRIESFVPAISSLSASDSSALLSRMQTGQVDAWIVHLAEGVRDGQRRPGDTFSSRGEFATLSSMGLLNDTTVIIHGNGLEPEDFAAMRAAASVRADETGDGLGAKLVWSPLSNLLLYGQTALIYHALKEGVTISLGTDWSPSGSRNLLDELKIADIALRDPRLLASDRDLVPSLSITGKNAEAREGAEIALDRLLVEMVTANPAKTLHWTEVGSIEPGKVADLLLITRPDHVSAENLPNSPYRNLIDATEKEVRLVLVNGAPLSGDVALMALLKPGHYETIGSVSGCFQKAIDVTSPAIPNGTETFAEIEKSLRDGLNALGGDNPPVGGGPANNSNTYSYLKSHIPGASFLTDAQIRQELTFFFGLAPDGRLNMEGIQLSPVFVQDDGFYFDLIGGEIASESGLIVDDTPPFGLYLSNLNQVQPLGNPFTARAYRDRYFEFCASTTK
jgi:5-methylthioadenosine/S-adenosylhomocysteine deaminase